ncbi:hypothetical protein NC661_09850 [Aquibacillus koreensis]|uniref:Sporulation protein n=1 Tax=Aquibacillus koreensis TaxID=279446 RepID=A0A9X4AI69_9BACI|nr:hypothetical protein [Aquibacillus koreensis]MCT2534350.1 hypothetical protein [Aquibacillus koreensis]MDC3420671.1 hypothetical protein [Aquibacillus koreensis]
MASKKLFFIMLGLIIILTACQSNENDTRITRKDNDENITKISNNSPISQAIANTAKEMLQAKEEIIGVRGVNTDKDLLLAIKVTQMEQFNEQDLENEMKKSLEKEYPNVKIDVSSDQKIFIELDELEKKIQENNVSKDKLKKDFKKIQKLMKDTA